MSIVGKDDELDLSTAMVPGLVSHFEDMSFELPYVDDVFDSTKIVCAARGGGEEIDVYGSVRRVPYTSTGWLQAVTAVADFAKKYHLSPEEQNVVGMMVHLGTFPVPVELSKYSGVQVGFSRIRPANYRRMFSNSQWEYEGEPISFSSPSYAGTDYVSQDVVQNLAMIGARGERVVISGSGVHLLQGIRTKRDGEVAHLVCSPTVSVMISSYAQLHIGRYEPAVFELEINENVVSLSTLYPEQHDLGETNSFVKPFLYASPLRCEGEILLIDGVQYKVKRIPTEELRAVRGEFITSDNHVVGRASVADGIWEVGPQLQIIRPRNDKSHACSSSRFFNLKSCVTSTQVLAKVPIGMSASEPAYVPTYCFGKYQAMAGNLVGGQTGSFPIEKSYVFDIKAFIKILEGMFEISSTITWNALIVLLQEYDLCVTANDILRACSKIGLVVRSNTIIRGDTLSDADDAFLEPELIACKTGYSFRSVLRSAVFFSTDAHHVRPLASGMVMYDDDWMYYTKKYVGWEYCDFMAWGTVRMGESHIRAMEREYFEEVGESCHFGNDYKVKLGDKVFNYGMLNVSPPGSFGITRLFVVRRSVEEVEDLPLGEGRVLCRVDHAVRPRMRHDLRIAREAFYCSIFSPT